MLTFWFDEARDAAFEFLAEHYIEGKSFAGANGARVALFNPTVTQYPISGTSTTNGDFTSTGHGLLVGDVIWIDATGAGSMAGGVPEDRTLYVVAVASNTFRVSLTEGGAAIVPSSVGSGMVAHEAGWNIRSNAAAVLATEVAAGNGYAGRFTYAPAAGAANSANQSYDLPVDSFNFTASGGDISFSAHCLLRDATDTPGTGIPVMAGIQKSTIVVPDGTPYSLRVSFRGYAVNYATGSKS